MLTPLTSALVGSLQTPLDVFREGAARMRESGPFPKDVFVIAQNGGGDYLILRPEAEGSKDLGETVYFWDHETGQHEPVADSLDAI